jgi:hypothetical protein
MNTNTLELQKQYLSQLRTNDGSIDPSTPVGTLSTNLDRLKTAYVTAGGSDSTILTKQSDVLELVNTENDRLNAKKTTIDQALDGQKRLISLNDSYRLKYTEYIKMLIIIIVALVIWAILSKLSAIGILPDALYAILLIILVTLAVLLCYYIYLDILSRNKMNFNELNIPPPKKLTPDEIKQSQEAAAKSGNLLGTINFDGCVGSECCSDGSKWDAGNSVCIGNTLEFGRSTTFSGFSTLTVSYNNGEILPPVSANSPDEFTQYSRV